MKDALLSLIIPKRPDFKKLLRSDLQNKCHVCFDFPK